METQIEAWDGKDGGIRLASAVEPLTATGLEDARVLAELARAVEDDLARPDLAASTERAYAHDWADFATFCRRHGLEACPPRRRPSRSTSNPSRRRRVSRRPGFAPVRRDCPSRRCGGDSPRLRANTRRKSLRPRRITRWSRNSCDAIAACAKLQRRKRTRSPSSGFRPF